MRRPARGFAWLTCRPCDYHRLVPFSCKGRGFCPTCGGRRMLDPPIDQAYAVSGSRSQPRSSCSVPSADPNVRVAAPGLCPPTVRWLRSVRSSRGSAERRAERVALEDVEPVRGDRQRHRVLRLHHLRRLRQRLRLEADGPEPRHRRPARAFFT
ncbi:MAG: transposase zinc-binding domain-containing protein [Deltaproteobacteria bacterium]|nr:transposase zinc-binding domain-containing protein [Deltaproteobacteria bacterium]